MKSVKTLMALLIGCGLFTIFLLKMNILFDYEVLSANKMELLIEQSLALLGTSIIFFAIAIKRQIFKDETDDEISY